MLLKDLQSHEEMCIKKYSKSANESQDWNLKQLFNELEQQERIHLNTIQQIMQGQVPNVNQQTQQASGMQANQQNQQASGMQANQQTQQASGMQANQQTQQVSKNPFVSRPQGQTQQTQQSAGMQASQQTQQASNNPFVSRPQGQTQQTQQASRMQTNQQTQQTMPGQTGKAVQQDLDLCHDLLDTEKFISSTYNTAIFEFNDANIRQVLNHIQKEEQEHGCRIYSYMKQNGGYQAQA